MTKQTTQFGVLLSGRVNWRDVIDAANEMALALDVSVHTVKAYPDLGKLAGGAIALCLEADRAPWLASLEA